MKMKIDQIDLALVTRGSFLTVTSGFGFCLVERCQPRGTVALLFDQRTIWGLDCVNKQYQFRTDYF